MSYKQQLKQINIETKYLVHGWLRDKENQFKLRNISDLIRSQCILYYFTAEEFAHSGQAFNIITTSNKNDTFARVDPENYIHHSPKGSVFGQINLNENKFNCMVWTFYVVKLWIQHGYQHEKSGNIFIGITNMRDSHLNRNIFETQRKHPEKWSSYGTSSTGDMYRLSQGQLEQDSAGTFKAGDTITMTYHRTDKTLEFKRNHGVGIATLENVVFNQEEEVNMFITCSGTWFLRDVSIRLLNFTTCK